MRHALKRGRVHDKNFRDLLIVGLEFNWKDTLTTFEQCFDISQRELKELLLNHSPLNKGEFEEGLAGVNQTAEMLIKAVLLEQCGITTNNLERALVLTKNALIVT